MKMSSYEISKSSLLSLKAEILRKEQDLVKVKGENEVKASIIKKNTPLEFKNKGVEARSKRDITDEEQDLLKLSSSKLAEKAAIYDKLTKQTHQSDDAKRRYLVQFDKKDYGDIRNEVDDDVDDRIPDDNDDDKRHLSDEYDSPDNSDDEWIEYIDCLGRSRKCLRKDLEYLKSKDADLKVIAKERKEMYNKENKDEESKEQKEQKKAESTEKDKEQELISGDMKREMLRKQWEKEEAELMNKNELHYQDVLFSEARQHGVGYYGFSKDEEERARQQEALKQLREETEEHQRKAQQLKAMREKQMAARMKAARNRKRARMGLPPEEDEPEESNPSESKEKTPEPTPEEQKKIEDEERLEQARKKHVRPWDVGKEGVKEFYEMTQEEWNETQRELRISEFAPPSSYSTDVNKKDKGRKLNPYLNSTQVNVNDDTDSTSDEECIGPPPPPNISDSIEAGLRYLREKTESSTKNRPFTSSKPVELPTEEDRSLKFTTKKKNKAIPCGTNSDSSDNESEISPKRTKNENSDSDGDFIGPAPPNISDSIEAGLMFIRNKVEQKEKKCMAPW